MGGGAWPLLVGGAICLVNSDNERDSNLLTSTLVAWRALYFLEGQVVLQPREIELQQVCDALRCPGPHARYTEADNVPYRARKGLVTR